LEENKFKNKAKETDLDSAPPLIEEFKPAASLKKKAPKKAEAPEKTKLLAISEGIAKIKSFVNDERSKKISGVFLILFSVYAAVAFTSYLFTWQEDQNIIYNQFVKTTFNEEILAQNWLGKTGAYISHLFIHKWFGISSFLLLPILFLSGFKNLFNLSLFPVSRASRHLMFYTLWTSVLLGMIFKTHLFYLGGAVGFHSVLWLNGILGNVGSILILLLSLMVFVILAYNPSFKLPDFSKKESKPDLNPTVEPFKEEETNVYRNKIVDIEPIDKSNLNFEEPVLKSQNPEVDENLENEFLFEEEKGQDVDLPLKDDTVKEDNEPEFEIEQVAHVEISNSDPDKANIVQNQIEKERLAGMQEENEGLNLEELGEYDPTLDLSNYQFPSVELLNPYGGDKSIEINKQELEDNKNRIVKTLGDYGITIAKIKASVGPTVTLYEIIPDAGVRISKIKNLEDDIALSLAALGIRIIAPMPGKGTIGIEVPNSKPDIVPMRYILDSEKFRNNNYELPIALGKTILNETFVTDLAKMPHLLMAGATGQGKSVGLNAVLTSLLYKKHPAELKFVLVDPKKVELTLYNKIERHFLAKLPNSEEAIITDTKKVIHTLNSLCIEMDNRYELLKDAQVRNIKEYNAKFISRKLLPTHGHRFLPYIVLVVDEFADLIMTAGKEVETPIARLAQLARAIGIHLIIATQRPSVNIITGTIKANFPARIAFRVSSKIDSRTILDAGGAEQLIGRGDMLLSTGNDLIRIQCAFVDTPEVDDICDFIGNQRAYPNAYELPEYIDENENSKKEEFDPSEKDSFFEDAARLIVQTQQGSTSLIQRKLKLGYNRAGRIIDQLEAAGIVGPFEGSKARQVLIKDEASLEQLLKDL
jgi:S-DNA-T family DNA segregation ATPase FtsK/SpoIIIE